MTNKKINKLISLNLPRVKSISFHPQKPLFIAGLHTGQIKSYTSEGLNLYTFASHEGSVRSVKFHPNSDFFVSGGDDKIINMFNYTTKDLLHSFKGHSDFIRSLDFHPTKPWIISSSDDQSIKIWNFLTKKLMATATGHSHYIMSAKFFYDKFIVSGSLDQTIRVWEFNQSKSKFVPDVIVKQIVQGHDRGINCIEVGNDIIVSGGDDREVKIWEFYGASSNEVFTSGGGSNASNDMSSAFNSNNTMTNNQNTPTIKEIDNYFIHQGPITSLLLQDDSIVSTGEDGALIIYKNKSHSKYTVDGRIWTVAYKDNIYVCGHDNGLDILEYKEPDLISVTKEGCYYYKNKFLYYTNLESEFKVCKVLKDVVNVFSIDEFVLIQYENKFCIYKDKKIIHEGSGKGVLIVNGDSVDGNEGNKTINSSTDIPDNTRNIIWGNIKDGICALKGKTNFNISYSSIENIILTRYFIYVRTGTSLIRYSPDGEQIVINVGFEVDNVIHKEFDENFNVNKKFECPQDNHTFEGYEISEDNEDRLDNEKNSENGKNFHKKSLFVVYNKNNISLYDQNLNLINQENELSHITGGIFHNNVFIYTTSKHIKYIFEETGILRSINEKMVPIKYKDDFLYYVKDYELSTVELDLTEIKFKESVIKNEDITTFIENKSLPGLSPLDFLIKKKKGDKALPYIKDERLRFELLLSENKLEECFEYVCGSVIEDIDEKEISDSHDSQTKLDWIRKIYEASLNDGNVDMAEKCLLRLEEWYELFLLYVCSGRDMKKIYTVVDEYTRNIINIYNGCNGIEETDEREETLNKFIELNIKGKDSRVNSINEKKIKDCSKSQMDGKLVKNENLSTDEIFKNCGKTFESENSKTDENDHLNKNSQLENIPQLNKNSQLKNNIQLEEALKKVTEGNFLKALDIFKSLFKLSNNSYDTHFIGMYISGLLSQIQRKKETDPYKQIVLSLYFSSLNLIPEHKILAQIECINVLYKNKNFKMAKQLINEWKIKNKNKLTKRLMECENDTDQFEVKGNVFCWDTVDFEDSGIECEICGCSNQSENSECMICENKN